MYGNTSADLETKYTQIPDWILELFWRRSSFSFSLYHPMKYEYSNQ